MYPKQRFADAVVRFMMALWEHGGVCGAMLVEAFGLNVLVCMLASFFAVLVVLVVLVLVAIAER